jgi:hypothetical protein
MGKGSSPRNNYSTEWYTNYNNIVWNKKPEIEGLTDDQSSAFRLAIEELKNRGLQITQFDEDRIKEAVVNDIPAGWNKE